MSSSWILIAVLTTVPGLRNAVLHDFRSGERFDVRCTVVSARQDHDCHLYVTDGSSFMVITSTNGASAFAGDVIVARGHVDLDRDGRPKAYAGEFKAVGKANPPARRRIRIESNRLSDESLFYHPLVMTGLVVDIVPDDIDPRWSFILLKDGHGPYFASMPVNTREMDTRPFIGATVSLVGITTGNSGGTRRLTVRHLALSGIDAITVLSPPPADPFDARRIEAADYKSLESLDVFTRRRMDGTVLAVWQGDSLLVRTDDGKISRADLADRDGASAKRLPKFGDRVALLGFPRSDLFNINLVRADFRVLSSPPPPDDSPADVSADAIFTGRYGGHQIQPKFHGRLIRIAGEVVEVRDHVATLSCGRHLVTLDASSCSGLDGDIARGCRVSAAGVCVVNFENFLPQELFPRINGITVVPRSADDVRVVSRPPWWTPGRLGALVGALVALLVAILVWNRALSRMIERRGRALFRSEIAKAVSDLRVDERTRLAVEIHDSISQTLTGVSFQIDAAEKTLGTDDVASAGFLGVAKRTLLSCREELRRCLWDLRNNTLEDVDFARAVEKTVRPHAGAAELSVRFNMPRHGISDSTAHAILSIIRELTVNAVRHGRAAHVRICGEKRSGGVRFSVEDDGRGFDPSTRPGPAQGHFGLQGVRERVNKLQGKMQIDSAPGRGACITVEIGE